MSNDPDMNRRQRDPFAGARQIMLLALGLWVLAAGVLFSALLLAGGWGAP